MKSALIRLLCLALGGAAFGVPASLAQVTRTEALQVAESYVNHSWKAEEKNTRHGTFGGVEIHTPDRAGGRAQPLEAGWVVGDNQGVPYKWGGFDTLASFERGIRAGKAAGDVYTSEKRQLGGKAVSGDVVGVDCSGFISRCWKLSGKHSTTMLFGISERLASPADLRPGDIMNTGGGHVLLFVKWLDGAKTNALFYEAAPFGKTMASERDVAGMAAAGFVPLRYKKIRD